MVWFDLVWFDLVDAGVEVEGGDEDGEAFEAEEEVWVAGYDAGAHCGVVVLEV